LLAKRCLQNDITVIIDTAGNVPFSSFEKILPFIHGIYFDIKTHKNGYTALGGDGELIYDNLKKLTASNHISIRIPIIPHFNDDIETIMQIGSVLRAYSVKEIFLLPFHRLGAGKYKALGQNYAFAKTIPKTDMMQIATWFSQNQIKCVY